MSALWRAKQNICMAAGDCPRLIKFALHAPKNVIAFSSISVNMFLKNILKYLCGFDTLSRCFIHLKIICDVRVRLWWNLQTEVGTTCLLNF